MKDKPIFSSVPKQFSKSVPSSNSAFMEGFPEHQQVVFEDLIEKADGGLIFGGLIFFSVFLFPSYWHISQISFLTVKFIHKINICII